MSGCPVAHGYEPLDPTTVSNPHAPLRDLREGTPVAYMPGLDHYIVTRFDDVCRS